MKLNDIARLEEELERSVVNAFMDLGRRVAAALNGLAPLLRAAYIHRIKSLAGSRGAEERWRGRPEQRELYAIIEHLARQKDMIPSELWRHLYAALEDAGLRPIERDGGRSYEYEDRKTITFTAFRRKIQRHRQ